MVLYPNMVSYHKGERCLVCSVRRSDTFIMSIAESLLSGLEGFLPCWVWFISTRVDGDKVTN